MSWVAPVREKKEDGQPDVEAVPIRRTARIPLSIPIIISGKDDLGRTFKETTRTIEVSKNGAKITTSHRLALHADIAVANPTVGSTCLAKVTWRGPRRGKEPIEIGVELLESYQPERIWGLESPPDDWLRAGPPPSLDRRLQYLCARDRTRPLEIPSAMLTEVPEVLPLPIPAPGSEPVAAAAKEVTKRHPSNGDVREMSPAEVKEALRQVAEAIAPLVRPDIEKSVEESAARVSGRFSVDIEERVQAVSRRAEEAVNSLHSAADGAAARLEILEAGFVNRTQEYQQELMKTAASQAEDLRRASESLLSDFQTRLASALEGLEHGEAEKAGSQIRQMLAESQARSTEELHRAAAAVAEQIAEDLKRSGAEIVESTRSELTGLTLASLRSVTEEAHAAAESDRARLEQMLEEQVRRAADGVQHNLESVSLAKDQAAAELDASRAKAEDSLAARCTEVQQTLTQAASAGVAEIEGKSSALLDGFQSRLQSTLEAFQERGTQEVSSQLQKIAAELQQRSAAYLEQQAAATVAELKQKLETSGAAVVEETEQRLGAARQALTNHVTQAASVAADECRAKLVETFEERARTVKGGAKQAVASIQRAAEGTLAEFEKARTEAQRNLDANAVEHQQRLAEAAGRGAEELERKSSALVEGFQGQLEGTLEAFQAKGAEEVAVRLQKIAAEQQQRSAAYLEQQAAATVAELKQKLETSGSAVVDETEQRLAEVRRSLTEGVNQAADAAAEQCRAKVVETFEERARTIQGGTEQAVASIHNATAETLAEFEKSKAEAQQNLEANAVQHQQRLAEVAGRGAEELERKSSALVEGFQGQLEGTLEAFQAKGTEEVAGRLQKIAAEQQQRSAAYLEQQSAATIQRLSSQLEASGTQVADETHARLGAVAKEALDSLTEEARTLSARTQEATSAVQGTAGAAVQGIEAARQKIIDGLELQVRESQAQIAALSASGAEGLAHKSEIAQAALAEQGARLRESLKADSAAAVESAATAASSLERASREAAASLEASRRQTAEALETALRTHQQTLTDLAASREQGIALKSDAVIQELERRQAGAAQTFHKLAEGVSSRADSAVSGISTAAGEAVTKLEASRQSLAIGLEGLAYDRQKKLEGVLASGRASLEQQSAALADSLRAQMELALRDLETQASRQVSEQLQKVVAAEEERWGREIQERTVAMLAKLNDTLAGSRTAMLEEAKRELDGATQMSLQSVTWAAAKECRSQLDHIFREQRETVTGAADDAAKSIAVAAEQTLAKLQTAEQRMEVDFESSAGGHQKQLADLASSGAKNLERTADGLLERFGGQLEQRLVSFQQLAGKELEATLQRVTSTMREQSARELRTHAEETERKLKEGLTASGTGVVEEARRLAGITRESLETLSQSAAEECRRRLNEFTVRSSAIHKQMAQLAEDNVAEVEQQVTPGEPESSRRPYFVLAAVVLFFLAPALIAVYLSTRPVMRLRPSPPSTFVDNGSGWSAKRRAAEQQLARAYWDAATHSVENIYHFGSELPATPPANFNVDSDVLAATGLKIDAAAERARYWQKLQEAWGRPEAWQEADGWHTDWLDQLSVSLQETAIKIQWKLTSWFPG